MGWVVGVYSKVYGTKGVHLFRVEEEQLLNWKEPISDFPR